MIGTKTRWVLGVVVLAAVTSGDRASAQGVGVVPSGPITNPYMSPYANPYLNPALTVGATNRNDALLYLWSAQQQPGALLGPPIRQAKARPVVAEMPRSAMTPGGGASRYFQRVASPQGAAPARRYDRHDRYFNSNGR